MMAAAWQSTRGRRQLASSMMLRRLAFSVLAIFLSARAYGQRGIVTVVSPYNSSTFQASANGTCSAPAFTFGNFVTTGLAAATGPNLLLCQNGLTALTISGAQSATFTGPLLAPSGTAAAPSYSFSSHTGDGIYSGGASNVDISLAGSLTSYWSPNFFSVGPLKIGFGVIGGEDVYIARDASNTLAQRNGTNAQVFNIYNTYTDASNYERGFLKWTGNVLLIGAEASGTGSQRDVELVGTTTNDNANPGSVGELIAGQATPASEVTLTTATTANVTSVSLTAGDWDCTGAIDFAFGATTSYTNITGGVSATSATLGAQDTAFDFETAATVPTAASAMTWAIPTVRESLLVTTTIYLVAQGTFTLSTLKAYGTLGCRRMR